MERSTADRPRIYAHIFELLRAGTRPFVKEGYSSYLGMVFRGLGNSFTCTRYPRDDHLYFLVSRGKRSMKRAEILAWKLSHFCSPWREPDIMNLVSKRKNFPHLQRTGPKTWVPGVRFGLFERYTVRLTAKHHPDNKTIHFQPIGTKLLFSESQSLSFVQYLWMIIQNGVTDDNGRDSPWNIWDHYVTRIIGERFNE